MTDIRPQKLEEFIGKQREKNLINIAISGAKSRKEALDHVLLGGNAGLGKTTLAGIIKNEMGVNIVYAIGNTVNDNIIRIITHLQNGDILFIDEIHRIATKWQELLYPAMEDKTAVIQIGSNSIRINLPQFTLIGATTEPATLSKPFRDRFGLNINLEPYGLDDMIKIATRSIGVLGINTDDSLATATEVAKRSRATPRVCNNILKRIRDYATTMPSPLNANALDTVFDLLNINNKGLDANDFRYLNALNKYNCPVGVDNISASTGVDKGTVEQIIEPFLLTEGLIIRTPQGRVLSDSGKEYLQGGKL